VFDRAELLFLWSHLVTITGRWARVSWANDAICNLIFHRFWCFDRCGGSICRRLLIEIFLSLRA